MKSDHRWLLGPDPGSKAEVVEMDGHADKLEPATPIAPAPRPSQTLAPSLAEAREEIIILRSLLHGVAASLLSLAGQLGRDVEAAAGKARLEADRKRRF
jgi:hypothetical protein